VAAPPRPPPLRDEVIPGCPCAAPTRTTALQFHLLLLLLLLLLLPAQLELVLLLLRPQRLLLSALPGVLLPRLLPGGNKGPVQQRAVGLQARKAGASPKGSLGLPCVAHGLKCSAKTLECRHRQAARSSEHVRESLDLVVPGKLPKEGCTHVAAPGLNEVVVAG